jgi:succinate dehydrogenase hydrophobic anchor subunit
MMRVFQMQRVSAIALLIFLGIHMAVMHYPPWEIDFKTVVIERLSNPIWKVIDIGFLLAVLVHALAGSYVVLTDLQRIGTYKRALAGLAIVLGLAGFVYGTMTIMAFQPPV